MCPKCNKVVVKDVDFLCPECQAAEAEYHREMQYDQMIEDNWKEEEKKDEDP